MITIFVDIKCYMELGAGFSCCSLYLNEFRKNLTSNLDRSLSNHSYGYALSSDQPTLFAIFILIFVPFMKYPDWHTLETHQ